MSFIGWMKTIGFAHTKIRYSFSWIFYRFDLNLWLAMFFHLYTKGSSNFFLILVLSYIQWYMDRRIHGSSWLMKDFTKNKITISWWIDSILLSYTGVPWATRLSRSSTTISINVTSTCLVFIETSAFGGKGIQRHCLENIRYIKRNLESTTLSLTFSWTTIGESLVKIGMIFATFFILFDSKLDLFSCCLTIQSIFFQTQTCMVESLMR